MASTPARTALDLTADLPVPDLADFYRDLHRHPELSLREHRTAGKLADRLRDTGFETTEGVGGTGVVGRLRNGDGPTVLLRADMDALPVTETTGLPYASATDGVMHACGHDLHVTWLAGAARALAAGRETWRGTLLVVGQPAEETGRGAARMVADGLYQRFGRPDVLLGQHATPGPAGLYPHVPGLIVSASTDIDIMVHGRGGHGSRPEATVDPVVTAAYLVTRLQTVVSREVAAGESAVLTVGRIEAGTRHNIIPAEARIALNLRTQSEQVRQRMVAAVRRITHGECLAAGCPREPEVTVGDTFPMTVNDAVTDAAVAAVHGEVFGADTVFDPGPAMGSEDFPELALGTIPYSYWFVTTTPAEVWEQAPGDTLPEKLAAVPSNHSPRFAPDLSTIAPGVRTLASGALALLSVA
ncbi:amidohydrolase [Streptomyces pluripotens]|uniref:Amidohydrolase n=1 Tax=Streptomyces pluripotens TaxID=1355015 RepID=A0A221NZ85_9ACTN|nr:MULTISPECIES: amidohydrolase [Streptomyces]ARP71085.1 amidohydrolase [Streptomyces pluripotens]ASN25333.1 amidohydrolase [Streptomyces pluripotens]KIE26066.1 amidohydrolase [Streptomyces sp. MUSC 125]MCH0557141.1 amidohydrolase [Streptomyces sp. MUM 16J]